MRFVIEKRRQVAHRYVTVFVERRRNDGASVFIVKSAEIRTAAEKTHAKRCLCNYHKNTISANHRRVNDSGLVFSFPAIPFSALRQDALPHLRFQASRIRTTGTGCNLG